MCSPPSNDNGHPKESACMWSQTGMEILVLHNMAFNKKKDLKIKASLLMQGKS